MEYAGLWAAAGNAVVTWRGWGGVYAAGHRCRGSAARDSVLQRNTAFLEWVRFVATGWATVQPRGADRAKGAVTVATRCGGRAGNGRLRGSREVTWRVVTHVLRGGTPQVVTVHVGPQVSSQVRWVWLGFVLFWVKDHWTHSYGFPELWSLGLPNASWSSVCWDGQRAAVLLLRRGGRGTLGWTRGTSLHRSSVIAQYRPIPRPLTFALWTSMMPVHTALLPIMWRGP